VANDVLKMAVVWDVAASISETSVNFYQIALK
jgi:hypothetical protein